MSRSARLHRSYQRTLYAGIAISALVHVLIFLSARWDLGGMEPDIPLAPQQQAPPDRSTLRVPLEVISMRALALTPERAPETPAPPVAEPSAAKPSAAAREPLPGPNPESDLQRAGARPAAISEAAFVPVPAPELTLAGGVIIPALSELDLEEVPNTDAPGTGFPLYRKGSVMSAKDEWLAGAGGENDAGGRTKTTFTVNGAGGVCPVRPGNGIFDTRSR